MPIGDRKIELLIMSHNHADHIGGLVPLLEQYKVDRIWLSGAVHTTDQFIKALEMIRDKQVVAITVKAGDTMNVGEANFIALFPPDDMTSQLPEDQHEATIVIKLAYREFCGLFTGDLNTNKLPQEEQIVALTKQLNVSINCPFLKVTHHGSASGTTTPFLEAVRPKTAVISVGQRNQYHHPAPSTLHRLRQVGAAIYRTDEQGTITIQTDGASHWTRTER